VKLPIAIGGYFADQICMLGPQNTHWLVLRSADYTIHMAR